MGDLFHCIHFLCDNVVTMIVQGADNIQLVVEWVVGTEVQVLIGVSGLSVCLHFHLPIFLAKDQSIWKKGYSPPCLWLIRNLYAASGVDGVQVFGQFISLVLPHHLEQIINVLPPHRWSSML